MIKPRPFKVVIGTTENKQEKNAVNNNDSATTQTADHTQVLDLNVVVNESIARIVSAHKELDSSKEYTLYYLGEQDKGISWKGMNRLANVYQIFFINCCLYHMFLLIVIRNPFGPTLLVKRSIYSFRYYSYPARRASIQY